MSRITTQDGTKIYNKDWGTGQPVVFSHGWPAVPIAGRLKSVPGFQGLLLCHFLLPLIIEAMAGQVSPGVALTWTPAEPFLSEQATSRSRPPERVDSHVRGTKAKAVNG